MVESDDDHKSFSLTSIALNWSLNRCVRSVPETSIVEVSDHCIPILWNIKYFQNKLENKRIIMSLSFIDQLLRQAKRKKKEQDNLQ